MVVYRTYNDNGHQTQGANKHLKYNFHLVGALQERYDMNRKRSNNNLQLLFDIAILVSIQ